VKAKKIIMKGARTTDGLISVTGAMFVVATVQSIPERPMPMMISRTVRMVEAMMVDSLAAMSGEMVRHSAARTTVPLANATGGPPVMAVI